MFVSTLGLAHFSRDNILLNAIRGRLKDAACLAFLIEQLHICG
jgi:hypothetical protein